MKACIDPGGREQLQFLFCSKVLFDRQMILKAGELVIVCAGIIRADKKGFMEILCYKTYPVIKPEPVPDLIYNTRIGGKAGPGFPGRTTHESPLKGRDRTVNTCFNKKIQLGKGGTCKETENEYGCNFFHIPFDKFFFQNVACKK